MMGKTHVAVGVALSLAVFQPDSAEKMLLAIAGGAIGGIICDIDCLDNDNTGDAIVGQGVALGLTLAMLVFDKILHTNILNTILATNKIMLGVGSVLFGITFLKGFMSDHRTFSHSFLAMGLFCIAWFFICAEIIPYFIVGFISHLFLDVLNKKKVKILYPFDFGICFYLFYANGVANQIFMWGGLAVSIGCIIYLVFSKL